MPDPPRLTWHMLTLGTCLKHSSTSCTTTGIIGESYAQAFGTRIEEVCETALASQRYHNDHYPIQPGINLVEFGNFAVGSMDYIQCTSFNRMLNPAVVVANRG